MTDILDEDGDGDGDANGDEVIRELDVFISSSLNLQILQFPLVPVYHDTTTVTSAQVKPKNKKLEAQIPYQDQEDSHSFIYPYSSSVVAHDKNLAAGVIHDNAFFITPIETAYQMRPCFKHLHKMKGEMEEIVDFEEESNENGTAIEEDGPQQVQMKRKDTERTPMSRQQNYTQLMKEVDMEKWETLKVNAIGSRKSETCFEAMRNIS